MVTIWYDIQLHFKVDMSVLENYLYHHFIKYSIKGNSITIYTDKPIDDKVKEFLQFAKNYFGFSLLCDKHIVEIME